MAPLGTAADLGSLIATLEDPGGEVLVGRSSLRATRLCAQCSCFHSHSRTQMNADEVGHTRLVGTDQSSCATNALLHLGKEIIVNKRDAIKAVFLSV